MWGGGLVVFLDDLGSVAMLGFELQAGQEVVAERVVEGPYLVQRVHFGGSVVAVVADQFADSGPVLLLDVAAVVLLPERPRVKVILRVSQ